MQHSTTQADERLRGEPAALEELEFWAKRNVPRLAVLNESEFLANRDRLAAVDCTLHLRLKTSGINEHLAEQLHSLPLLVSLDLGENGLGDWDVERFLSHRYANLQWLSLAHNAIEKKGVRHLVARWRESLPALIYVSLASNPCDPTDEIWFADGYQTKPKKIAAELEAKEPVPWLHYAVEDGQLMIPDRFELVAHPTAIAHSH